MILSHRAGIHNRRDNIITVTAYKKVAYEVARGIARISLNRPERRNALDQELLAEFRDALRISAADEAVRVVLVTGAGPDFCSGMDLRAFAQDGTDAGAGDIERFQAEARNFGGLLLDMRRHPRPIVAAVHGRALGGGCGIATAADLVLAADSAQFGYPEINIGFVAAIVLSILRRSVSEKRAFDLITSGEAISAPTALDYGMINRVFETASFPQRTEEFVANLASKSASALAMSKELLYRVDGMRVDAAVEAGAQVNAMARTTDDFKRGVANFFKKP